MILPETLDHFNGMQPGQRIVYCPEEQKPEFHTINKIERVRGPNGDGTCVRFYVDGPRQWIVASHETVMSISHWEDSYIDDVIRHDPVASYLLKEVRALRREVQALKQGQAWRDNPKFGSKD